MDYNDSITTLAWCCDLFSILATNEEVEDERERVIKLNLSHKRRRALALSEKLAQRNLRA